MSGTHVDPETAERDIRAIEARLDEARVSGDMSVFETVLGPGFRTTSPVGGVSLREQALRDFASRALDISHSESTDITVRVFGDVAVITGVARLKARVRGHSIDGAYPYTHVYAHGEGGWQVVAAHSSRRMPDWLFLLATKISRLFGH